MGRNSARANLALVCDPVQEAASLSIWGKHLAASFFALGLPSSSFQFERIHIPRPTDPLLPVLMGVWRRPGGEPLEVAVKTLRSELLGSGDEVRRLPHALVNRSEADGRFWQSNMLTTDLVAVNP